MISLCRAIRSVVAMGRKACGQVPAWVYLVLAWDDRRERLRRSKDLAGTKRSGSGDDFNVETALDVWVAEELKLDHQPLSHCVAMAKQREVMDDLKANVER